jgi:hypothetical protein
MFSVEFYTVFIDFTDVDFEKFKEFYRIAVEVCREVIPDEKPLKQHTDNCTLHLAFVSLGHCLIFLCYCKSRLELLGEWATLSRVNGARLGKAVITI